MHIRAHTTRKRARARLRPLCAFFRMNLHEIYAVNLYYLMSLSLKFHKDLNFGNKNIGRTNLSTLKMLILQTAEDRK